VVVLPEGPSKIRDELIKNTLINTAHYVDEVFGQYDRMIEEFKEGNFSEDCIKEQIQRRLIAYGVLLEALVNETLSEPLEF